MGLRSYPRLFFELVSIGFTIIMSVNLMTSFLPILASDLDPSELLVGMVVSVWFLSRVFIELPAGIISDRIGRRKLYIFGLCMAAVGALMCTQASNIYLLILGRGIMGLGTAFFFMNNMALIIDIFDAKVRGRALGIFYAVEFIGSFIGVPIGALLAGFLKYQEVFYVTLALNVGALGYALASRGFSSEIFGSRAGSSLSLRGTLTSLRNWGIAIVCVGSFSRAFLMQGIFSTVLELYLSRDLLYSLTLIGIILSLRTAGHIVATASSGFLSDRFGRRTVAMAGFLLDGVSLIAFTVINSPEAFLTVCLLEGMGEGLVFTSLIVLLSDYAAPLARGSAIGLYRTFMDLGGFTGPLLCMMIYGSLSAPIAFIASAGLNFLNVALIYLLGKVPSISDE